MLGTGAGRCLDLGCGQGFSFDLLRSTGREVVGVDLSREQLRRVPSGSSVALSDAACVPFPDEAFDVVAAIWISCDVDDITVVAAEATRVLRPSGRLVLYGVHPCFNGPWVEGREDGGRIVHPGYRQRGWVETSPWWSADGIRHRVGMRHVPLAELLNAVISAGLRLEAVDEPRDEPIPYIFGLAATKTKT